MLPHIPSHIQRFTILAWAPPAALKRWHRSYQIHTMNHALLFACTSKLVRIPLTQLTLALTQVRHQWHWYTYKQGNTHTWLTHALTQVRHQWHWYTYKRCNSHTHTLLIYTCTNTGAPPVAWAPVATPRRWQRFCQSDSSSVIWMRVPLWRQPLTSRAAAETFLRVRKQTRM